MTLNIFAKLAVFSVYLTGVVLVVAKDYAAATAMFTQAIFLHLFCERT